MSSRISRLSKAVHRATESGPKIFSGSKLKASVSYFSVGAKATIGNNLKVEGKVGIATVEGKISYNEIIAGASFLEVSREVSSSNIIAVQATANSGTGEVSIDKNLNLNGNIEIGTIESKVQVGNKANASLDSNGKIEVGAKASFIEAVLSISTKDAAEYINAIGEALVTSILPESFFQDPDDNFKHKNK